MEGEGCDRGRGVEDRALEASAFPARTNNIMHIMHQKIIGEAGGIQEMESA